ncbi:MAG: cytochrome c oxidase assembly protein [Thermoleophilia bacterium]|nr:cytochrome c oxidase assembly protein [Thermoleophilia bacterium]
MPFDPLQLAPVVLLAAAYEWRARTLARRGTPVAAWRRALLWLAVALLVAAASPLDRYAEELFTFHMVQHVLLGDLAALALVGSLTGPLLRPLLAVGAVARLRVLAHPLVALPVWTVNLLAWHVPAIHEAALAHDAVHALQHTLFLACGALMWAPVVEVLPGPVWFGTAAKLGYIVVVRLIETVLGNVFLWSGTVFYDRYEIADAPFALSRLEDQGWAGTVMMVEGSLVTLAALAWLFLRLAAEGELRQQLLERGLDPQAVRRAVRYGRAHELD